jgi:hypothetical protein
MQCSSQVYATLLLFDCFYSFIFTGDVCAVICHKVWAFVKHGVLCVAYSVSMQVVTAFINVIFFQGI